MQTSHPRNNAFYLTGSLNAGLKRRPQALKACSILALSESDPQLPTIGNNSSSVTPKPKAENHPQTSDTKIAGSPLFSSGKAHWHCTSGALPAGPSAAVEPSALCWGALRLRLLAPPEVSGVHPGSPKAGRWPGPQTPQVATSSSSRRGGGPDHQSALLQCTQCHPHPPTPQGWPPPDGLHDASIRFLRRHLTYLYAQKQAG